MLDSRLAELLGNAFGDGSIEIRNRYRFQLRGHISEDKEHYENFIIPTFDKKLALPITGRHVKTIVYKLRNSYGISIENEALVKFLVRCGLPAGTKNELNIPYWIRKNKSILRAFLRGLFDTDGTVYFSRNYSSKRPYHTAIRIVLTTTSKCLCKHVYKSLCFLDFRPYKIKPFKHSSNKRYGYRVQISRISDVKRWIKDIGSHNPKHYTKYRIWSKYGFCPPNTSLSQRKRILEGKLDIMSFYNTVS